MDFFGSYQIVCSTFLTLSQQMVMTAKLPCSRRPFQSKLQIRKLLLPQTICRNLFGIATHSRVIAGFFCNQSNQKVWTDAIVTFLKKGSNFGFFLLKILVMFSLRSFLPSIFFTQKKKHFLLLYSPMKMERLAVSAIDYRILTGTAYSAYHILHP